MGFLQEAEQIATQNSTPDIALAELEALRAKYEMDDQTYRQLCRFSRRGRLALVDLHAYFDAFSAPFINPDMPQPASNASQQL